MEKFENRRNATKKSSKLPKRESFSSRFNEACNRSIFFFSGWVCRLAGNVQEIPFDHIWSGTHSDIHCSFVLEQIDRGVIQPNIACKINVYQKQQPARRQVRFYPWTFSLYSFPYVLMQSFLIVIVSDRVRTSISQLFPLNSLSSIKLPYFSRVDAN